MKKLAIIGLLIISTMSFSKGGMGSNGSGGGMGSGMNGDMSQTMDQMMDQTMDQTMDRNMDQLHTTDKTMDQLHFQDKLNQETFMNLSSEQQVEFMQMQNQYQNQYQNHMSQIAEINKKMNQEMNQEKLNAKQLKRLRKQKTNILEKIEKNRLTHRIKMREKFGIDPEDIE